jgi:hypothetical protein
VGTFSIALKAYSLGFDPGKIEEIPSYKEKMSDEEFERTSREHSEVPFGDKYLAYKLRLPKDWYKSKDPFNTAKEEELKKKKEEGLPISRRLLGEVARYYGTADMRTPPRLEILALELEHEITAKNWFLNHVFTNGYALQGLKEVSDRRIDGLYVMIDRQNVSYKVRMAAEINGPRMVLIKHFLPERNLNSELNLILSGEREKPSQQRINEVATELQNSYFKELAQQEYIIESFKFLNPEKARVELTRTYSFLDLLRFDYPSSWRLVNPEIVDIQEMSAQIMNTKDEETLSGEISINILSTELDTDISNEMNFIKEDLADRGLELKSLIESPDDFNFHSHVFFDVVEVYEVTSNKTKIFEHEFWVAILLEDRYYYIVTMITPGRGIDFYNWARNTEAFEKVIETMRP